MHFLSWLHFFTLSKYTDSMEGHVARICFKSGNIVKQWVRLSPFSRVESRFNSHNQNAFQGDLGDDKRKAVLIMGLETPFRDAAFISTFSGVELRFPNDFQGDFCRW